MKRSFVLGLATASMVATATGVQAQSATSYPDKTVTFVVGYAPGGATDRVARLVAKGLSDSLKQSFVVENRAGANSNIGAEYVIRAKPDGYTVYVGSVANTVNQSLYKKLNFNILKDFEPVVLLTTIANILVINPNLPIKNVQEYVAYAKQNPGKLTCASSGAGSSIHLSCELFKMQTGTDILHVPYKGSGPAVLDLVGGQVDSMFDNLPSAIGQVRGGKLRALAVTSTSEVPFAPGVPTIDKSGVPGFDVTAWFGLYVPTGTPKAIVDRLNAEVNKVLATPEIRKAYEEAGFQLPPQPNTPQALSQKTQGEVEKWAKVIEKTGLSAN